MRAWIGSISALVAMAAATQAKAQHCPPRPPTFRPHVSVYPGDTLLARPLLELPIYLRHVHCTVSRAPEPRIPPSQLRATVVEGPHRGQSLAIRALREQFAITMPGPGDYVVSIASAQYPALEAATVRVHVMDPARVRPVRFALALHSHDPRGPTSVARCILSRPDGTRLRRFGLAYARGRTTPVIALEPGEYSIESADSRLASPSFAHGVRAARVTIGEAPANTRAAPVRVDFDGALLEIETDYSPHWADHVRFAVVDSRGTRTTQAHTFPMTLIGTDLAPGAVTISVERASSVPGQEDQWRELHRETLQIQRQSRESLRWSLASILSGQGSAHRPWWQLTSFDGVRRSTPRGDIDGPPAFFAMAEDSLVIFTDRLVQRTSQGWVSLTMPTGWHAAVGSTRRSVAARAQDSFAWLDVATNVSYRSAAGISRESIFVDPRHDGWTCFAFAIAKMPRDRLVVVGDCRPIGVAAPQRTEGFIAIRDEQRWTVRGERFEGLFAVASRDDRVIAAGDRGTIVVLDHESLTQHTIGAFAIADVQMGRDRTVLRTYQNAMLELDATTGRTRAIELPLEARGRSVSACFAGAALVVLAKRRDDEPASRSAVFVDDGRGFAALAARSSNAIELACGSREAWLLDQTSRDVERPAFALERLSLTASDARASTDAGLAARPRSP